MSLRLLFLLAGSVLGGISAELPALPPPALPPPALPPHAARPIVLTFTGDILLDRGVRRRIETCGGDVLFTPSIDSIFAASDIVVGNLECPATSIHAPAYKRFIFRAEPSWLDILRRHHFTHLNLANNHSVDQGRSGLKDTHRQVLAHGMVPIGAAPTAEEAALPIPLISPLPSPPSPQDAVPTRSSVLGGFPAESPRSPAESPRSPSASPRSPSASPPIPSPPFPPVFLLPTLRLPLEHFFPLPNEWSVSQDPDTTLLRRIHDLRRNHPKAVIIVTPHWGWEHHTTPEPEQRYFAQALIDAGADCIIGHHTHTLQTHETYRGRHIFYSIGNFIFDQTRSINTRAAIVKITINPEQTPATSNRRHSTSSPRIDVKAIPINIRNCVPYLARPTKE